MFNLTRGEELTALICIVLAGVATARVCLVRGDKGKTIEIPLNNPREITVERERAKSQGKIIVQVAGEVRRKGVFELKAGSRVKDAIELAGATEAAALEALNMAAPLVDGERILVPRRGATSQKGRLSGAPRGGAYVNINTASQEQLESIPGIGPVLAGRIIEFRVKQKFGNVDELLQIKGIGPVTLEKIRGYVSVR